MSLTIKSRPLGHVFDRENCIDGTITEDGGGIAQVTSTYHGLVTGSYVYLRSNVENYNGVWLVTTLDAYRFHLSRNGDTLQYIVDADVCYYESTLEHYWSAIHLPIVYELESDLFPTNGVDTARTISSQADDNGYTQLTLSGSLGTFSALDSVKISDFGVYRIVEKTSSSIITIDLAYDATNGITSETAQLYYNNYTAEIEIWAGIPSGHQWETQKPMELIGTLNIIPDENNLVRFSIAEMIKSKVFSKNNTLLATLPNNIDAWTGFYIKYRETYDQSDSYTLSTFEGSQTTDSVTGYAANAKLAFRNPYSGHMSEYLMNSNTAKFLTMFVIPILFGGCDDCYQDVSFIIIQKTPMNLKLRKQYYTNDVLQQTIESDITMYDEGVYRAELPYVSCDYDRVDISVVKPSFQIASYFPLSGWTNDPDAGVDWTIGIAPSVLLTGAQASDDLIEDVYGLDTGTYQLNYEIVGVGAGSAIFKVQFFKSGVVVGSTGNVALSIGSNTGTVPVVVTDFPDQIRLDIFHTTPVVAATYTVNEINVNFDEAVKSETKEIEINCNCARSESLQLMWLNPLGGFDSFTFLTFKGHEMSVNEVGETKVNTFPTWDQSYGEFAQGMEKQTYRNARESMNLVSQHVDLDTLQGLKYLKTSPLVQVVTTRKNVYTVKVDQNSFTVYNEEDKQFNIALTITRTDDTPSQSL